MKQIRNSLGILRMFQTLFDMTGINGGLDTYAKGKTEMVLAVWQWGCAGTCKTSDKLEWPSKAKHGFDRCKVGLQWQFHASHIDDTLADASDTRIEKIPCQKMGSILFRVILFGVVGILAAGGKEHF